MTFRYRVYSAALSFATLHTMPPEFSGNFGLEVSMGKECHNTGIPRSLAIFY